MSTKKLQILGNLATVDSTLTQSGQSADAKVTGDRLNNIEGKLAGLLYEAITIPSLSLTIPSGGTTGTGGTFTKSPVELGTKVTSVTLNWTTSKDPVSQTLTDATITAAQRSYTYTYPTDSPLTDTKTYTLKATEAAEAGKQAATATKSVTLTFCNRVCYGVAAMPTTVDSDFVMGLTTKNLATSRANSNVNYNAGEGQYLWYCVPTRLGKCSFIDNGTGLKAALGTVDSSGAQVENATISVTNASGYTENYYVYRSDYSNLGSLSIKVS